MAELLQRRARAAARKRLKPAPEPGMLASYLDHTLLRADATPDEIERQVVENLEAGVDMISPGCAISPRCPNANFQAMVRAVTQWHADRNPHGE